MEIGSKTLKGWKTNFEFGSKEVTRGFWRYCKSFSRPLNQKKYYEVTIPASQNEGDIDIIVFGNSTGNDKKSTFQVALNPDGIPKGMVAKYHGQTKKLLLDFKKDFYLNDVTKKIEKLSKDLNRLSRKYEKALTKEDQLDAHLQLTKIKKQEETLELLRKRQFKISGN